MTAALDPLAKLSRWVLWELQERAGRPTKVPVSINGYLAAVDDPTTWATRAQVEEVARNRPNGSRGGIGTMLGDVGRYFLAGIDLDTCRRSDGTFEPWAQQVIDRINSYTEISPSETGAKAFFLIGADDILAIREAMGTQHSRLWSRPGTEHPPAIELHVSGRYFTVTDKLVPSTPDSLRRVSIDTILWLINEAGPTFAGKATPGNGGDNSRSAKALAAGGKLVRSGASFEQMCEGLRNHADPDIRAWVHDKGDAYGGRELLRIWEKIQETLPPPEEPPGWDEPPAGEEPWPDIDAEAFYGLAGEITFAIAPLTEADPVAILAQLLAAFGSAFGRGAYYRVGDTQHFPNLFEIIAGQTAKSRKGTSYNPVEQILRLADEVWANQCVHSGLSSGEGIIHAVHDGIYVREKVSGGKGQPPTYVSVLKEPAITDKRLLVMEQELAVAFAVMKREGNTLAAVLRLAWDGRKLQSLVKHSPESATGAHVSVVGHITVEELRSLLDRIAITNGLANRFLIVLAKRTNVLPFPSRLDPEIAQGFAARIKALLTTLDWRQREVLFDPQAEQLWIAEYTSLSEPQPGLFGFATARAEAQVLRLAMIYALLDQTYRVQPVHLRAALAFWRYCEASAKHILGDFLGEPIADDILRALRQVGSDGMTRSEIYEMLGRNKSSETIGAALALLLKHNKASCRRKPTPGRGRPTEIWSAI